MTRQLSSAPIIAVAIDLADHSPLLAGAIRTATQRILATEPNARLACLYVLKIARVQIDEVQDEKGRNLHLRRLAELEHWSQPLVVDKEKITYQVLEAVDPAGALIHYARENMIDHLVIGARASSTMRRYLGSVSAKIVAEAPCTVTVVRPKAQS
jgi:nucleotide-binding universal stress UspA family protein